MISGFADAARFSLNRAAHGSGILVHSFSQPPVPAHVLKRNADDNASLNHSNWQERIWRRKGKGPELRHGIRSSTRRTRPANELVRQNRERPILSLLCEGCAHVHSHRMRNRGYAVRYGQHHRDNKAATRSLFSTPIGGPIGMGHKQCP